MPVALAAPIFSPSQVPRKEKLVHSMFSPEPDEPPPRVRPVIPVTLAAPIFSPSQVPRKEKLLHSMFSPQSENVSPIFRTSPGLFGPSIQRATTIASNSCAKPSPQARVVSQHQHGISGVPLNLPNLTLLDDDDDDGSDHFFSPNRPSRSFASSSSAKPSPRPRVVPQYPHGISAAELNLPNQTLHDNVDDDNNNHFFSPIQPSSSFADSSGSPLFPVTPLSDISLAAGTSFSSLPSIEWLKLENIKSCTSRSRLEHIIRVLSDEECLPSLLRAAHERLAQLRATASPSRANPRNNAYTGTGVREAPPGHGNFSEPGAHRLSTSANMSHSTLVMSLSTDDDDDDLSSQVNEAPVPPTSVRREQAPPRRVQADSNLHEVARLTNACLELEAARNSDQERFLRQLSEVKHAHQLAEDQIRRFQSQSQNMATENQELEQSYKQLVMAQEKLTKEFQLEKQRFAIRDNEMTGNAELLQRRIDELTAKLAATSLRLEERSNHAALKNMLRQTQADLSNIKSQRDTMVRELLSALGDSTDVSTRLILSYCRSPSHSHTSIYR
jgi:hypothetical protein